MTAALDVRSLRVRRGRRTVLDGLSFAVGRGSIGFVAGDNGAGRSTLLAALAGLIPRQGDVVVAGRALPDARPAAAVRAGLAVVPERRQLFPGLTVEDNLLLGLYTERHRTVRAARRAPVLAEIYERFPILAERQDQAAGTLSGGEQQMLAIGRALVTRPDVILLDEPFLGIAPGVADTIKEILVDLRARGTALLIVDDNEARTAALADEELRLVDGRLA